MNQIIKNAIECGKLILLFGAGASLTSKNKNGNQLLSPKELAQRIAEKVGWDYKDEKLATVYAAGKNTLGEDLNDLLESLYKHCEPSYEYITIAKQVWARIYTLNIDDAFDVALRRYSPQIVNLRNKNDKIFDQDQIFRELDYIKLNGSIDRLKDGFIFSPKEYGSASAATPLWYRELAFDFFKYTFLFIGTSIDEPLFYHQIERHLFESNTLERKSYVLTPTATQIEKESLLSYNLEHISGTLLDFADWLSENFKTRLTTTDVAVKRNPALGELLSLSNRDDRERYANVFKDVTLVNRANLNVTTTCSEIMDGQIKQFYKGFKPQWDDILNDVPAEIQAIKSFYVKVKETLKKDTTLVVLYGPAGSGKSTLLMKVALNLADKDGMPVYFLNAAVDNLENIIKELEKIHDQRYCIFYDRLEAIAAELRELIKSKIIKKGLFIGSERQHKWESVAKEHLYDLCEDPFQLHEITEFDADLILKKIEKYGPWTRLSLLKPSQRINELFTKAKRQLLIGLLETTYGEGFIKIIKDEYSQLGGTVEQYFVTLIGLATIHRYTLSETFVSRGLDNLGIKANAMMLANKLSGIIVIKNNNLQARHPVYIQNLFDSVIDRDILYKVLKALLYAYTVYEAPVIKRLNRNDSNLFKALLNHKFLKYLFRESYEHVVNLYVTFEKPFENDALFWLQYGLALRDFSKHYEAYEKIQTAYEAYPQPHTEHALAQQELIIACMTSSKSKAFDLLNKAKIRLEGLDKTLKSFDIYPIVTLSEGHTKVIRTHEGEINARELARQYANIIESRRRKLIQDYRLKKTWQRLSTYALTGEWIEENDEAFYIG